MFNYQINVKHLQRFPDWFSRLHLDSQSLLPCTRKDKKVVAEEAGCSQGGWKKKGVKEKSLKNNRDDSSLERKVRPSPFKK